MSQHSLINYQQIIQQQQEQLVIIQAQIQMLLAKARAVVFRPNTGANTEVA